MLDAEALRAKLGQFRTQESSLRTEARGETDPQRRCELEDAASEWAEVAQQIIRIIRNAERSLVMC
jgi:hypothetical protein